MKKYISDKSKKNYTLLFSLLTVSVLWGCEQRITQTVNPNIKVDVNLPSSLSSNQNPSSIPSTKPTTITSSSIPVKPVPSSELGEPPANTDNQSQAYWMSVDLEMTGNINNIYFANFNSGWIVGDKGLIRHTKDAGKSWIKQDVGEANLTGIQFLNENQGWAWGYNVIRKTDDGGSTWKLQDSGLDSRILGVNAKILDLEFLSEKQGIIVTPKSIYETNDGGDTWVKVFDWPQTSVYQAGIIPIGKDNVMIISDNLIWMYNQGRPTKSNCIEQIDASRVLIAKQSELQYWLLADRNTLYKTVDGGLSWALVEKIYTDDTIIRDFNVSAISFASPNEGVMVLGESQYYTKTGGENWIKDDVPSSNLSNNFPVGFPGASGYRPYLIGRFKLFGDLRHGWAFSPINDKLVRLGTP